MPASLVITGLTEFRTALRHLPEELASEAVAIVNRTAEGAANQIRLNYPQGPTGNLKKRVTVQQAESRFGAAAIVKSAAPHAYLYEHGFTRKGKNTTTKKPKEMVPIAIRARSRMLTELIALVRRAGFEVDL